MQQNMARTKSVYSGHLYWADTQACPYNSWFIFHSSVHNITRNSNPSHTHVTRMSLHGCHMGVTWVSHGCRIS
jgi:hypothetical protein